MKLLLHGEALHLRISRESLSASPFLQGLARGSGRFCKYFPSSRRWVPVSCGSNLNLDFVVFVRRKVVQSYICLTNFKPWTLRRIMINLCSNSKLHADGSTMVMARISGGTKNSRSSNSSNAVRHVLLHGAPSRVLLSFSAAENTVGVQLLASRKSRRPANPANRKQIDTVSVEVVFLTQVRFKLDCFRMVFNASKPPHCTSEYSIHVKERELSVSLSTICIQEASRILAVRCAIY